MLTTDLPGKRSFTVEVGVPLLVVGVILQLQWLAPTGGHWLVRLEERQRLLHLSGRVDGGIRPVAVYRAEGTFS